MLTEKAITTCLLEVLREYSDESHILSMGEIITKINAVYGYKSTGVIVKDIENILIKLGVNKIHGTLSL